MEWRDCALADPGGGRTDRGAGRTDPGAGRIRANPLAVRPPLEDLRRLIRLPVPSVDARRLLLVTTCVAAAAAFLRDRIEHGTVSEACAIAGIEGMAVVVCFFVLGPALGLSRR